MFNQSFPEIRKKKGGGVIILKFMKYLKKFNQTSEYEVFKVGDEYITPNVSFVKDSNEVMFNSVIKQIRIFDDTSYDDRKALYDLCFTTAKSENCTTPIYVR